MRVAGVCVFGVCGPGVLSTGVLHCPVRCTCVIGLGRASTRANPDVATGALVF